MATKHSIKAKSNALRTRKSPLLSGPTSHAHLDAILSSNSFVALLRTSLLRILYISSCTVETIYPLPPNAEALEMAKGLCPNAPVEPSMAWLVAEPILEKLNVSLTL